ncbi:MAG TPA: farnesyl diphosphate synthase [Steroidobacteraceae bacterium]|nr:farnesyl diphosphate synthase [Steroidobacteraceae bacterium]
MRDPVLAIDDAFPSQLERWQQRIENALDLRLPATDRAPVRLHEAIRYSVLGGGKRVRPALTYATAAAVGLEPNAVDGAACAVELIHAYSLVHDDLPAMDDDDLRRGRPTCHRAYDEATAILVGDALQVLAFRILAADAGLPADPATRLRLIEILAEASGTEGMAGGQALDLAAAGRRLTTAEIEAMHARKTGALIRASVMMAAGCAPELAPQLAQGLDRFASSIGLAFQIQDDLLDVEGDPTLIGKATGADSAHEKPTYPAVAGVAASRERVSVLHRSAFEALEPFGPAADPLRALANWLLTRRH